MGTAASVHEFEQQPGLMPGVKGSVETAAELVVERLGEMPKVGHYVIIDGWRVEIGDMDDLRIDKLIVQRDAAIRKNNVTDAP